VKTETIIKILKDVVNQAPKVSTETVDNVKSVITFFKDFGQNEGPTFIGIDIAGGKDWTARSNVTVADGAVTKVEPIEGQVSEESEPGIPTSKPVKQTAIDEKKKGGRPRGSKNRK
jgi:hypothetical protein